MSQTFDIDRITGHDFEDLVARIMKKLGYKDMFLLQNLMIREKT